MHDEKTTLLQLSENAHVHMHNEKVHAQMQHLTPLDWTLKSPDIVASQLHWDFYIKSLW